MRNVDGLLLEYTEGIVTVSMNIRTNSFGESERRQINKFLSLAQGVWEVALSKDEIEAIEDDATPTASGPDKEGDT